MKFYVIASTEYEANMPDTFLMDENGNYYGVTEHSYATWDNYPKSADFWRNAQGSDSDRYFNIDYVEISEEMVAEFDTLTKEYIRANAEIPKFGEKFPNLMLGGFKTKKAYNEAVKAYEERYNEWKRTSNVVAFIAQRDELFTKRTRLFLSFSKKVYDAISDNENIKRIMR